jgi:hypothetical protein
MKNALAWLKDEWFAILFSAVIVLPNAFWWFDNSPPTDLISATISTPTVEAGGTIVIDYKVNRFRACSGDIQRVITDSQGVTHLIAPYSFLRSDIKPDQGVGITNRIAAPVPVGAASGKATYHAEIDYYCNPQQRVLGTPIKVTTPEIDFDIIDDPKTSGEDQPRPIPQSDDVMANQPRRTDLGPSYDPIIKTDFGSIVAVART